MITKSSFLLWSLLALSICGVFACQRADAQAEIEEASIGGSGPCESRIPISRLPYTISTAGSYFLTGFLTDRDPLPGGGIKITSSNVTLDLNGYSLRGIPSNAGSEYGIIGYEGANNIVIKNGKLQGWYVGIRVLGESAQIFDVQVSENHIGITVDSRGGLIKNCSANKNQNNGFMINGSIILDCTAVSNESAGIVLLGNSMGSGNLCSKNKTGIYAESGSVVLKNICSENLENGIKIQNAGDGCRVEENSCTANGQSGIVLYGKNSQILRNSAIHNLNGISIPDGSAATDNQIDSNTLFRNTEFGLNVWTTGNAITRNQAAKNGVNYQITTGNDVAPIGTAATLASPWANLSR